MTPKLLLLTVTLLLSQLRSLIHGFLVPGPVRCRSSACSSLHDAPIEKELPSTSVKVGIIGAGSIAFGTASLLSSLGHDPMLWSPSGAGTKELIEEAQSSDVHAITSKIQANGAQQLMERAQPTSGETITSKIQSTGVLSQEFDVRIARSTRELVRSNDNILVVAIPVNCHKDVMDRFASEIIEWIKESKQKMRIIISSHASLGAVYLMQLLRSEWLSETSTSLSELDDSIRITCWGTTAITARKTSGNSVNVLTIRKAVDYVTVPFKSEEDTNDVLETLFGKRFKYRDGGLLAISLSNLNPQNHLGIVLGNMSRMDPPPPPPPLNDMPEVDTPVEPWYQGKCITPKVGRLMEALDLERINIAKELEIDVRTIYEHFSWSFHVPLETPTDKNDQDVETSMRPLTVSEMNQQMHYYKNNDVLGPTNPESRYVMEDVPYGLVLTVILGRLLNCPASLHESGIMILSAMYGRDFLVENELLQGLGLIGEDDLNVNAYSLQEWKEMACVGYFRER
mmetsp:Transcript_12339/g.24694  ORF Transcript_12339/g.24694 Transcript_12339/m.24694 type:complete len:511 (-) Transcript_12339:1713-3245(-)